MAIANLECPACECRFQVDTEHDAGINEAVDRQDFRVSCPDCGLLVRCAISAVEKSVSSSRMRSPNLVAQPLEPASTARSSNRATTSHAISNRDAKHEEIGTDSSPQLDSSSGKTVRPGAVVTGPHRAIRQATPRRAGPIGDVPTPQRLRERRRTPPPYESEAETDGTSPSPITASPAGAEIRPRAKLARPSRLPGDSQRESTEGRVESLGQVSNRAIVVGAASSTASSVTPTPRPIEPYSHSKSLASLPSTSQLARKRSGRKLGILLITAGGSLVALLAVVFVLTQIQWQSSRSEAGPGPDAVSATPNADKKEARDSQAAAGAPAIPRIDPSLVAEVWSRCNPYLITMQVDRNGTTKDVAGVIIDNRGWIATSLPAIAGADRIRLKRAASTDQDDGNSSSVDFESRGVIAVDAVNHVALLSFSPIDLPIDRDPVLSIDEFPALESELVAAGVPKQRDAWLAGCHLAEKRKVKPQAISELANVNLAKSSLSPTRDVFEGREEMLTAMVLDLPVDARFEGGPLFRTDGALAGIIVVPPDVETQMWAVSVAHVRRLKEFSRDVPIPFDSAELVGLKSRVNRPNLATDGKGPDMQAQDHAAGMRPQPGTLDSRDYLSELLQQCRDAEWSPQNAGDYLLFQQLGEYLTAAEQVAVDESIDEGLRLLLNQIATEIREEMSRTPWPSLEAIGRVNRLAIESLAGSEDGFYGYAQVVLPPGLAPEINGAGSVVMQLLGHDARIILPVTRSFDQLRTDSQWLIVGSKQGGRKLVLEGEGDSSAPVSLIYAIHIGAKPELIAGEPAE